MVSKIQLKLYRAILVRMFGPDGLEKEPQVALRRARTLTNGSSLAWRVAFNPLVGDWTVSFELEDGRNWDVLCGKVLAEIAGEIGYEIYDYERRMEHVAEQEAQEEAELYAEARHIEQLAKIGTLNDEELLAGYLDALTEDLRATDCVQEWSWHPSYTGDDDPGLGYYEEQSRLAGEIRDAFESEMKRRGLYADQHERVFDQATARRGYNDDSDPRFWPAAKSA